MDHPLPLTDRPAAAVLFRTPGGPVTAAGFLADAARLAATLPARAHVANLCRDRYRFAVGFAAALLRGQVSLLSGDPSAGALARLARDFPDAYALTDDRDDRVPGEAMPSHPVGPVGSGRIAAAVPAPPFLPVPSFPVPSLPVPAIPAGQPAAIVLTSGSTGSPLGTAKCWGELVARSRAAGERFGLAEEAPAAIVATVPPGHMYGLELTVLLPLHAACAVWCGPAFFPADVAAALDALAGALPLAGPAARAEACATAPGGEGMLVTTPLHLRALAEAPPPTRPPGRVVSATAPLDRALAGRVERLWGSRVLEIFGATEVGSIASRRTVTDEHWSLYPGVTLSGSGTAPLAAAPWAAPRRLADVVRRAADGRSFRLVGRESDLVKRGGRRASLAGLTRILLAVPGVRDGAFLVPDTVPDGPASRLSALAVAPGHSAASLMEALRAEIDPVFLPRPLLLLDALPRNATGKLPRTALLAALADRDGPGSGPGGSGPGAGGPGSGSGSGPGEPPGPAVGPRE